jgi:hypothetical protein
LPTLKNLLLAAPNSLVLLTTIAWLATGFERFKKRQIPNIIWAELVAVTVFLPQLRGAWPFVGYLPRPLLIGSIPYSNLGIALLPALLALPGAFVYRRLPGYILSVAGAVHVLLFLVIMLFYNRGAIA